MAEQAVHLPVPLPLRQPQMRVHQVQWTLGTVDDKQLRTAWLSRAMPQQNPVAALHWPSRQHEVAVAAFTSRHVRLKYRMRAEVAGEQPGLIIEPAPRHETVHLLQADQVGILRLDAVDDPRERIPPVPATDPLVDVPTQQSHGMER